MQTDDHRAPEDTAADLARLAAERDELRAELERVKKPRRRRLRRGVVALLVALSCILVVLSTTVVWAHRTVLNTDVFVSTVGPVFETPGVDSAVAARVTDELFVQLRLQARLRDELPPKLSFVAVPLSNAAQGFVTGQLTKVFASPQFQTFWTNSLRTTHQQVVAVLRGQHTTLLSTAHGYIVLNTVPVVNQALGRVGSLVSNLTGKHVTLPTITSAELPQQAVDKLSKALGVTLPSNFGQITLVRTNSLAPAQRAVQAFDRLAIALPLLTIAFIAVTLWLSPARRRTLLQLLVASLLLLIVERRVVIHAQSTLAAKAHNPQVAQSVLGELLHGFFVLTAWIIGIGLAVLVVALLSGPYPWAVALRSGVVRGWHRMTEQLRPERRQVIVSWMSSHANVLQLVSAVIAGVLLLIVSVTWWSFLIVGVLLAAVELALQRIKSPPGGTGPSTADDGARPRTMAGIRDQQSPV